MSFGVESASVTFSNSDTATYTFTQSYPYPPTVTATAVYSTRGGDVNIHIDSVTNSQVVLRSSAKGNFTVHVHVMGYPNT